MFPTLSTAATAKVFEPTADVLSAPPEAGVEEATPVAVKVKEAPRCSSVSENSLLRMTPYSFASEVRTVSALSDDSRWRLRRTVSPAAQPVPWMTTVSPGW